MRWHLGNDISSGENIVDIKALLLEARRNDKEWLKQALGSDLISLLQESSPREEVQNKTGPINNDDSDANTDVIVLLGLGYSLYDIEVIDPSARRVIAEKRVRRPRRGLPKEWLFKQGCVTKPRADDFVTTKDEDELNFQEPIDNLAFWPDEFEFRQMLLDESKWRSRLLGNWILPMVKQEAKWRYGMYKNWLQILENGIGEGFDEVSARFDEKLKEHEGGGGERHSDKSYAFQNRMTYQSRLDSGDDAMFRSYFGTVRSRPESRAVAYEKWLERRIDYDENKWTDFSQYGRKVLMEKMEALEKEGHTKLLGKRIDGSEWFDDDYVNNQQTFDDFGDKPLSKGAAPKNGFHDDNDCTPTVSEHTDRFPRIGMDFKWRNKNSLINDEKEVFE